tara:strand:+ start:4179 stop:6197 length:2019 start_codon:yes stop_codon:yes gene_type:complete
MSKLREKILAFVKRETGAALIQVMLMSGLLGVVSLGILYLNDSIQTVATVTAQNMEVFQLFKRVQTNLKNKETCDATFKGVSPLGGGTNIKAIKSFVQGKNIFEQGIEYGQGRGKITIQRMTLKDYNNGTSVFEIAFKRGEKDTGYSVRRLNLNTRIDNGVVTECLLDDNKLAKNNCENGFLGSFSDGVNCKSIKVTHGQNNNYAIKTFGNIEVENNLEAANLITTELDQEVRNEVNVKTETKSGGVILGDTNQAKLKADSQGLFIINLKEKGNKLKALDFLLSKRISFKFEGDNLIIDGKNLDNLHLKRFKSQKNYVREDSISKTNPKGIVATRAWFYKNLESQFSDTNKEQMQKLVEDALESIENQALNVRKNKEDVVLAFGRNICSNYYKQDYEWDEVNKECKLRDTNIRNCYAGTYEESGFVSGSSQKLFCKKYRTSTIIANCIREEIPCLKTRGIGSFFNTIGSWFGGVDFNALPCVPGYPNNPGPRTHEFDWANKQVVHVANTDAEGRCQEFKVRSGSVPATPPSGGNPVASIPSPCDNAINPGANGQTRITGNKCERIEIQEMSYSKSNQAGCDNDLGKHNSFYNGGKCWFYVYKKQSCSAQVVGGSTVTCSNSVGTTSDCSDSGGASLCSVIGGEWEVVELDSYDSDINEVWNQLRTDEGFATN